MSRRGRSVLALGLVVYLAAWAFGSKPLYPVAAGLLLAVGVAWAWVHLSNGPVRVHRNLGEREHVEGDDVQVAFAVELTNAGSYAELQTLFADDAVFLGPQQRVLRGADEIGNVQHGALVTLAWRFSKRTPAAALGVLCTVAIWEFRAAPTSASRHLYMALRPAI